MTRPYHPRPIRERFDEKWIPEPNTGCWLWLGKLTPLGYSRIRNPVGAFGHRVAWELYRGPIPAGMVIDHICRERSCVNPDHLRVVSRRTNAVENSLCFVAINAQKKRCVHGHIFDRLRVHGNRKFRACSKCEAAKAREFRRRRKSRITVTRGPSMRPDAVNARKLVCSKCGGDYRTVVRSDGRLMRYCPPCKVKRVRDRLALVRVFANV